MEDNWICPSYLADTMIQHVYIPFETYCVTYKIEFILHFSPFVYFIHYISVSSLFEWLWFEKILCFVYQMYLSHDLQEGQATLLFQRIVYEQKHS